MYKFIRPQVQSTIYSTYIIHYVYIICLEFQSDQTADIRILQLHPRVYTYILTIRTEI